MMNGLRKRNGVITVFVSLMLVSVLSLGTLVIEAGRFQAAKNQLADATISSSTSMIAAYNPDLYDRYGLLSIDTGRFTEARAREYLEYNADLSPSFFGNRVARLYSIDSIELQGMYNLTYPAILKQQILSRAKYHVIPQDYALNLYNIDAFFADLQNKCDYVANALTPVANGSATAGSDADVNPEMLTALNELYETFKGVKKYDEQCNITLTSGTVALLPSTTGTVESTVPAEDAEAIQSALDHATSILGGSASNLRSTGTLFSQTDVGFNPSPVSAMTEGVKDVASLSDTSASARTYAANCKSIAQGINASINMLTSDKEGNLLLNSYISEYFSNRNYLVDGYSGPGKNSSFSGENGNFAAACVEYIFGGSASERINQESAYNYILSIRLINNLYAVLTNSSSFQSGNAYSTLSHIAWAYYETCCDLELITTYTASVPMNKYNMILNVNAPEAAVSAFASKDFVGAMKLLGIFDETKTEDQFYVSGVDSYSYRDSLALALWLVTNSTKMMRTADLIQLEMRYREQYVELKGATFLMSEQNTYCRIKCQAKLNSILPILSLGSNSGVNGISFTSIKYAGY